MRMMRCFWGSHTLIMSGRYLLLNWLYTGHWNTKCISVSYWLAENGHVVLSVVVENWCLWRFICDTPILNCACIPQSKEHPQRERQRERESIHGIPKDSNHHVSYKSTSKSNSPQYFSEAVISETKGTFKISRIWCTGWWSAARQSGIFCLAIGKLLYQAMLIQ